MRLMYIFVRISAGISGTGIYVESLFFDIFNRKILSVKNMREIGNHCRNGAYSTK